MDARFAAQSLMRLSAVLGTLQCSCDSRMTAGSQAMVAGHRPSLFARAAATSGNFVPGGTDTSVTWAVVETNGGTISDGGIYTAPAMAGQYHITATSHIASDIQGIATAVVVAVPVSVSVAPAIATAPTGGTVEFAATVSGASDTAVTWSVQEVSGCGSIDQAGVYTAPDTATICHVIATSHADLSKFAVVPVTITCWQLAVINRVRFYPRAGQAAAMVGGTIQGSNDGPTNGFTVLAAIEAQPNEGEWTELTFANAVPYRYVKYYGPTGSYGQIAEIEFYSGSDRLSGSGFGTAGSRSGNPWQNAVDGNTATFFDGLSADNVYVGIDIAAAHVAAGPSFTPPPGGYFSPMTVAISSATADAAIRYTTDGSDPAATGRSYGGPVAIGAGATTLRAIATKLCMLASEVTGGLYTVGSAVTAQSSLHIGNSLTDSIDGYLFPVATAGGITLDYWRYTVPGAGTYVYQNYATGGLGGISNVQTEVRTKPYTHISMQPASNMPCLPTGYASEPDAGNRSDAVNIDDVWNDAVGPNAAVEIWVYSTWPGPAAYSTCMTGGGWLRDPAIWNPPAPANWEDGVAHMTQFNEAVRTGLIRSHPDRPVPYIIPAGAALVNLKRAVEAGTIPGVSPGSFWTFTYAQGFGTDDHLTSEGRYLVTLVFYASMFQRNPAGLPHANTNLSDAQAAALQQIAWQTVTGYALSGFNR